MSRKDRLGSERKLEEARVFFEKMQAEGLVDVDDYGNVSPSKRKPESEFQDFDQQPKE